jgi:hypothetical protein
MSKSKKIDLTDLFQRVQELLNAGHSELAVKGALESAMRERVVPKTV